MFTINYAKIMEFVQEHKSITVDMCKILFYNTKFGYDSARRALTSLNKNGYLKVGYDFVTDKKVYYINKKLRSHDLMLLSLYTSIIALGGEEVQLRKEYTKQYYGGRSDGLMAYKWHGEDKIIFVEIDMQNKTKIKKYLDLFNTGYFQERTGVFPRLLIVNKNKEKYEEIKTSKIEVVYSDYKFSNLKEIL